MNFQHLRFAVAVADTGSFTSAADLCCVTQPALSNAVGQLEDELGAKLFERTTRSVRITKFGATVIDQMRDIVDARLRLLTCAADFLDRDEKTVRIGLSPLISSEFSRTILARSKEADLNIILTEMNKADIAPALHGGTIDLGFCPTPQNDTKLRSTPIYSEPLLFVSDRRNGASTTAKDLEEIARHKVLLVSDDCGLSDTVRIMFNDAKLILDEYEGRALGYNVLEKWARMGIGITLLPASQVNDLDFARPLRVSDDNIGVIQFDAYWTEAQERRSCFEPMMACLRGFGAD